MPEGGDGMQEKPDRKDLWRVALGRSDRHIDRDITRDTRAPDRATRKVNRGSRK